AADYEASFARPKSLPGDIFLMPQAKSFGLAAKSAARTKAHRRAFVDPKGCAVFIAAKEKAFRDKRG
ncbi:MAG: CAU/MBL1b family subclass B3 metallo-beta-lactamase, partial [Sphingopyxis sp.]|nr:CAU/MBL1b family subclass B3 metallo-beta-lactamase [Sphingopyxis sp.]